MKILLAGLHHDADLGFWHLIILDMDFTAVIVNYLEYVFCKLGCTAVVNENELIRDLIVLNSRRDNIKCADAVIGFIAINAKSLKLLDDFEDPWVVL